MFTTRNMLRCCFIAATLIAQVSSVYANSYPDRPAKCQQSLCLVAVNPVNDSDDDGVSDIDEEAAGTDPYNASSVPPVLRLIELAAIEALPSLNGRFTEIISLPTTASNGMSLGSGQLDFTSPVAQHGLSQLGINLSMMSSFGINLTAGARVTADPTSLLGTPHGKVGAMSVGGLNSSLISAGGNDLTPLPRGLSPALSALSPNNGTQSISHFSAFNGSHSEFGFSNGTVDVQERTGNEIEHATIVGDGNNTLAKGKETIYPAEKNADGSTTESSTLVFFNYVDNTRTTSGTTKTTYADGSEIYQQVTVTTKHDSSGNVVSSTTETTVRTTDSEGNSSTTTTVQECSNSSCSSPIITTGKYVNPDADTSVVWLTPDDVARIVEVTTGSNTTPGPSDGVTVGNDGWAPSHPWTVIALVDADSQQTTIFVEPRMPGAEPRTDPRVDGLIETLVSTGCARCPK